VELFGESHIQANYMNLYIYPGVRQTEDAQFLVVTEEGEVLYSHVCSSYTFAKSDLVESRPERIDELNQKYGEGGWTLRFIDEEDQTDITGDQLWERNQAFYKPSEPPIEGPLSEDADCGCGQ
jgi:hypothetical protein